MTKTSSRGLLNASEQRIVHLTPRIKDWDAFKPLEWVIEKSPIESFVAPKAGREALRAVNFLEDMAVWSNRLAGPVDVEVKNYYVMNSVMVAAMFQGMEASFGRKFTERRYGTDDLGDLTVRERI